MIASKQTHIPTPQNTPKTPSQYVIGCLGYNKKHNKNTIPK